MSPAAVVDQDTFSRSSRPEKSDMRGAREKGRASREERERKENGWLGAKRWRADDDERDKGHTSDNNDIGAIRTRAGKAQWFSRPSP